MRKDSFKPSKEQHEFIADYIRTHSAKETSAAFNERYGAETDTDTIKRYKYRKGLVSDAAYDAAIRRRAQGVLMTEEQIEYLRELSKGHYLPKITAMFNERFGTEFTPAQIRTQKKSHKIRSSPDGENIGSTRYRDVSDTYIAGRKGKKNRTSFEKRNEPRNILAVGSLVMTQDGYYRVKVSSGTDVVENWKFLHRMIWELHNGPVPDGHCIIFVDQNRRNVSIDNLRCVSETAKFEASARMGLVDGERELNSAILTVAELKEATREKKKAKQKGTENGEN